jgi:serine/threonine protein kinase
VIRAGELLGEGGSSQVWRAIDATGRHIALKTLQVELRRHPGGAQLLRREHALLTELAHAHVVAVFGLMEFRGAPALAMEYLGGGDLMSLAGGHPRHWIGAARDLLVALTHVHAHGYAHRDLKARNVLFDEHNRVRLVDFASAARFGVVQPLGGTTAAYRPVGGNHEPVGPHEDVFAFAVLLYELMFGRLPFGPSPEGPAGVAASPAQPEWKAEPAMRALVELVLVTLAARDARTSGSLFGFADVIESVAAANL